MPTGAALNPQHANTKKSTFNVAADYQFADGVLGYASFSRGYKSLAYNLRIYSGTANKPEILYSCEARLKTDLFDRRVRTNLAGFLRAGHFSNQ